MNVLAFDTSSSLGSVAIGSFRNGGSGSDPSLRILARGFLTERARHSSGLLPLIRDVTDEAGIELRDLSGIAVGSGPGSFTGVRVAAATAKGLVRALGLSLHRVSSLAAGAASLGVPVPEGLDAGTDVQLGDLQEEDFHRPRYVLFDAREDRIYSACYRMTAGAFETLAPPRANRIGDLLEDPVPEGALFAGDGALRHAAMIREAGFSVLPPPAGLPTAEGILRLVAPDPGASRVEQPGQWEPEYLREWSASPVPPGPPAPGATSIPAHARPVR